MDIKLEIGQKQLLELKHTSYDAYQLLQSLVVPDKPVEPVYSTADIDKLKSSMALGYITIGDFIELDTLREYVGGNYSPEDLFNNEELAEYVANALSIEEVYGTDMLVIAAKEAGIGQIFEPTDAASEWEVDEVYSESDVTAIFDIYQLFSDESIKEAGGDIRINQSIKET